MQSINVQSSIDEFIWPNKYLLTVLGYWPMNPDVSTIFRLFTYFRIAVSIFSAFTLFVPELLMIIVHWGDISILTEIGCVTVAVIQLIFKLLYMVSCQRKFCDIYWSARKLWLLNDNENEKENIENLAEVAKRFTIVFFISGISNVITIIICCVILWVKNELQTNEATYKRILPFDIWYGFDTQRTPNFEIVFCCQSVAMILGVTGVVGFDSTMMTLILHICRQFKLIHARFRAVGCKISEDVYPKLSGYDDSDAGLKLEFKQCIEHHRRAIRIANEMNSLLSPVIFIQLITSGVEICLCGYALMIGVEGSNANEMAQFAVYLVTIFLQLTIWCWPGELLIQESGSIGDVVCYELPWYKLTISLQRDLCFIVFRSQEVCQVTALGYQVMSLRKLTEVFNTAASYFALLRSVSEKQTK